MREGHVLAASKSSVKKGYGGLGFRIMGVLGFRIMGVSGLGLWGFRV